MDSSKLEQKDEIFVDDEKKNITLGHRPTPEVETKEQKGEDEPEISKLRAVLPQIIAVSFINLILLNLGMVLAFPTVVIPDLLKSTGNLKFTEEQASWFGSAAFVCQPLGSLFSGLLFDPIGRKRTMVFVNLPLLLGWLFMYFSTSIAYLYVGIVTLGISIGFLDAPHITYVGEITQPKLRGMLTSYAELCVALGFCFVYFTSITANWKTAAGICALVPVTAMLLITQIPESPVWLLSKERSKDAERSLRWLRGWVSPKAVEKEFSDMVRCNNTRSKDKSNPNEIMPLNCDNQKKLSLKKRLLYKTGVVYLSRRSVFRPLILVIAYFGFSHIAGVTSTRPFLVEILNEFGTPLNAHWVTAISSVIGIVGCVIGMIILPKTGKRLLTLISIFGCAVTNCLIATCSCFYELKVPVILVSLIVILNFMWSMGIGQVPWMLISEVFPFEGRGVASGIGAACAYLQAFIFIKTYYVTYNSFTISGVFGFYSVCTFIGGIILYYYLPETEGKTLEQIESLIESYLGKGKKPDLSKNEKHDVTV